jgi:hypothetical protein
LPPAQSDHPHARDPKQNGSTSVVGLSKDLANALTHTIVGWTLVPHPLATIDVNRSMYVSKVEEIKTLLKVTFLCIYSHK